jgi:hypothetical protein
VRCQSEALAHHASTLAAARCAVKVIGRLEADDVLVVTRLDRLARSTRDLLNVIDAITKRGG